MADSTLAAIRTKVRRLTRSPSPNQITDVEIDEYVNTFIQFDIPQELELFSLTRVFTFYTEPNIDTYSNNTTDPTDPLFNFVNLYINFDQPIYIDGNQAFFSQSREEFFNIYPFNSSVATVGTGDGGVTNFTGTLTAIPVLRNEVVFSSIDANNDGLRLSDDGAGALTGDGTGTINYVTGVFDITFSAAPAAATIVESHTVPYSAARPTSLLYFNNEFKVRPVPDKVYKIDIQANVIPSELLAANVSPELNQWWQYIAYGASKKIFEDRTDMDSIQIIMPEFRKQQNLVNRRTIRQNTTQRTSTIYDESPQNGGYFWNNWNIS